MKIVYVNVYLVDRFYGGPEEGGWYYDAGRPFRGIPTAARKAERLRDKVWTVVDRWNGDRVSDISSVSSDGCYTVLIEDGPPAPFPEGPVHYE